MKYYGKCLHNYGISLKPMACALGGSELREDDWRLQHLRAGSYHWAGLWKASDLFT